MKKIFLYNLSFCLTILANAQWVGPTNGWLSTGNSVSISQTGGMVGSPGTTFNPLLSLSLTGFPTSGPGSVPGGVLYPFHVTYEGRVGVGTNAPAAGFHIRGTNFLLTRSNGTAVAAINPIGGFTLTTDGHNQPNRGFFISNGSANFFSVTQQNLLFSNGATDLFKVDANGYAYARKMVVTLANPFPDYVFETNYKLMPLSDLATFIAKNKHLPNMPSAQQVADNNNQVELGEMQTKLLEKVEELTLYILQQQAQIDELKRILAEQH
jgi:hypothetical protein